MRTAIGLMDGMALRVISGSNMIPRHPPATLARRLVTGSRSAGSLLKPRMPTRNPSHKPNVDMEEEKGQMR